MMMSFVVFVTTAEHIARSVTIQQALCITQAIMPHITLISTPSIMLNITRIRFDWWMRRRILLLRQSCNYIY